MSCVVDVPLLCAVKSCTHAACGCLNICKVAQDCARDLAGFSKRLQLLGISTVAANQTVDKVTDNALRICEAAGLARIGVHARLYLCWVDLVHPPEPHTPACASGDLTSQPRATNATHAAYQLWHRSRAACAADVVKGQAKPILRAKVRTMPTQ